jgi:uncharacterized protein YndB with AHSA1/START domain
MSTAKKVGIGLGGIIVAVVAGGYLLPSQTILQRSIEIQAPIQTVFHLVNNLPENAKWSPWKDQDPTMTTQYSAKVEGVGATMSWDGQKMKKGQMVITDSKENESIVTDLDFGKQGKAQASWTFEPTQNGVKVSWNFMSDNGNNPIKRYIGALFVKPMLTTSYDKGLASLKRVAEDKAAVTTPAPAATDVQVPVAPSTKATN